MWPVKFVSAETGSKTSRVASFKVIWSKKCTPLATHLWIYQKIPTFSKMGFIFLGLLGVSLKNLNLFFGMFFSFQPQVFHPPLETTFNSSARTWNTIWCHLQRWSLGWFGSLSWKLSGRWRPGGKKMVRLLSCGCFFFWDVFLDAFFWEKTFGNSKNKHAGGWKKVPFWVIWFQVTVFLFGVPAKQKHPQEAEENFHVLEIWHLYLFQEFFWCCHHFFRGDFVTFKFWGKFQAQDPSTISQPSLLSAAAKEVDHLQPQPLTGVKLSWGKCVVIARGFSYVTGVENRWKLNPWENWWRWFVCSIWEKVV